MCLNLKKKISKDRYTDSGILKNNNMKIQTGKSVKELKKSKGTLYKSVKF